MTMLPEIYLEAQKNQSHELMQVYFDRAITPRPAALTRIVCRQSRQDIEEYVDKLIFKEYVTRSNRNKLIDESEQFLADPQLPVILIATPKLVGAQFPLNIICAPKIFDFTEPQLHSLVVDNYVFMAKQIYTGFMLPDGTRANNTTTPELSQEKLTAYLYFSGKRNQLAMLSTRNIRDGKFCSKVEASAIESLLSITKHFPGQSEDLRLSIEKILIKN
jgi:hypothetical protein